MPHIPGSSVRNKIGRAIAEAVSRWFPTAEARVQSRVWSSGICGGQSGAGAGFLRVLRFPLPFIPQTVPHSSIIRGWYNRPISGRRTKYTQSHPTPRNYQNLERLSIQGNCFPLNSTFPFPIAFIKNNIRSHGFPLWTDGATRTANVSVKFRYRFWFDVRSGS
jgi:hypothetical protein